MNFQSVAIRGVAYPENKAPSKEAAKKWEKDVEDQTRDLHRVRESCAVDITFFLPPSRFSADLPHGPDLDNLLKRFIRALEKTVFSEATGKDSCIVSLTTKKVKAASESDGIGAWLKISPLPLDMFQIWMM